MIIDSQPGIYIYCMLLLCEYSVFWAAFPTCSLTRCCGPARLSYQDPIAEPQEASRSLEMRAPITYCHHLITTYIHQDTRAKASLPDVCTYLILAYLQMSD